MIRKTVERLLPHDPEVLFDLAADVERYPEFLPWWSAARVIKREGDTYTTDQTVGFGPLSARFHSKTVLHRPRSIEVTSSDAPFRHFRLTWIFERRPAGGTRVTLATDLALRSILLERLLDQILQQILAQIVAAFERQARLRREPGLAA